MENNKVRAIFLGWQDDSTGHLKPFLLFNVVGGPQDKSTLGIESLNKLGIEIPKYPTYEEWRKTK